MCGRFTLRQRLEDLMRTFNVSAPQDWQMSLRYNIGPMQKIPIIRQVGAERELAMANGGSFLVVERTQNQLHNVQCQERGSGG